jgi:hypothetical protein
MIDADITWNPQALLRMVDSTMKTKGIVGGVASKRAFGKGIAMRLTGEGIPESGEWKTGVDKLLPAYYVGAAFMGIHRDVVLDLTKAMPKCVGNFWPLCACMTTPVEDTDKNNAGLTDYLSEDWALCRRALDAGHKVWVDCWPILEHIGEHHYSVQDAFAHHDPAQAHLAEREKNSNPEPPRPDAAEASEGLAATG